MPHAPRRPLRVAFLTNFVSPYRRPVFEDLARTAGWDFRVFVNSESEFDRSWSVDVSRLQVVRSRNWAIRRRLKHEVPLPFTQVVTTHVPIGLYGDLRRFRPDVIVSSELGPRTMVASAYARLNRTPLLIWSYHSRKSGLEGGRRDGLRRRLLRGCDAAIGMGVQAREVLRGWGVEDERIFDAPNAADHASLAAAMRSDGFDARVSKKRAIVAPGKRVALVVGNLIPRKGIAPLLEAWGQLSAELRDGWRLVFLGDGPLKPLLEAAGDDVYHAGFVAPEEMAEWYGLADLHVFPTLMDVWGLVVNESMACGVPTLCSVHAGCSDDLIDDGSNGLLFDPTADGGALAGLERALGHNDLAALGRRSVETAAAFTVERLATSFRTAVDALLGRAEPSDLRRAA
ncbi:MAG: glycosyltransferase family 4 protein [Planctomycetota bacterium]